MGEGQAARALPQGCKQRQAFTSPSRCTLRGCWPPTIGALLATAARSEANAGSLGGRNGPPSIGDQCGWAHATAAALHRAAPLPLAWPDPIPCILGLVALRVFCVLVSHWCVSVLGSVVACCLCLVSLSTYYGLAAIHFVWLSLAGLLSLLSFVCCESAPPRPHVLDPPCLVYIFHGRRPSAWLACLFSLGTPCRPRFARRPRSIASVWGLCRGKEWPNRVAAARSLSCLLNSVFTRVAFPWNLKVPVAGRHGGQSGLQLRSPEPSCSVGAVGLPSARVA